MAQQKKSSGTRSGSGAKNTKSAGAKTTRSTKSASNARSSSNAKGASGTKGAAKAKTAKSTGGGTSSAGRKSAGGSKTQTAARTKQRRRTRPIRREAGGILLLFLGIVAAIALFPAEGVVVDAWRRVCGGLVGWGFYLSAPALLWGSFILIFHRGRPVALRLTCVLLLTVVFGAFAHMLWCERSFFVSGFFTGIADLWDGGQLLSDRCGGVIAGLLGIALRGALSKYGAFIVLVAAFLLMTIEGMNLSLPGIAAAIIGWYRSRPKLFY